MNPSIQEVHTRKHKRTETYWLNSQIALQNRFENLAQNMQDSDKSTSKTDNKVSKALSIFMAGIVNVIPHTSLLNRVAKNEYNIKVLSNNPT